MTQVFIEGEEAFVFEQGVEVIKLDDSRAYRRGVQPWMQCKCVDFVIRTEDRFVLLEAKNYDRPSLLPGSVPSELKALPDACGGKVLGALAVAGRGGLRDRNHPEFEWATALFDLVNQRVSFGLYVRLPAARRYTGQRAANQRQRVQRALGNLRRQLARTKAVGWLTQDVHLVRSDSLGQIAGLVAIEPAPRLWTEADRDTFASAIEDGPAFGDRSTRRVLRTLRTALPDGWTQRMPDLGGIGDPLPVKRARAYLRADLDWLDADHADRRDESGEAGLIPWAHAAVKRLLDDDAAWHRWVDGDR